MNKMHYSVWLSGLIGVVLSIIVNLIVLFVLKPFVAGPTPLMALNVMPVAMLTFIGTVGAVLVYALMRALMKNPNRTFIAISVIVFLLSLIPDYMLLGSTNHFGAGATVASVATLMLMHAVAGIIIVWSLLTLTKPKLALV
jgi:hypothetical protein